MSEESAAAPSPSEIKCVGVIGAGLMGHGIAHVFAVGGYDVKLSDQTEERLQDALATIAAHLQRQVEHGKLTAEDKAAALARIETGTEMEIFKDCDLVIESLVENEEI